MQSLLETFSESVKLFAHVCLKEGPAWLSSHRLSSVSDFELFELEDHFSGKQAVFAPFFGIQSTQEVSQRTREPLGGGGG